ncbi:MAG: hypothetical protein AAB532_02790 [Patescibacteria group bacterium]
MGCEYEPSETHLRRMRIIESSVRLRHEIRSMGLGDFHVEDLGPILRVMHDFQGDSMLNDVRESDITQLSQRMGEIKQAALTKEIGSRR